VQGLRQLLDDVLQKAGLQVAAGDYDILLFVQRAETGDS